MGDGGDGGDGRERRVVIAGLCLCALYYTARDRFILRTVGREIVDDYVL